MITKIVSLEDLSMSSRPKKRRYPHTSLRVYISAVTSALFVILAVLLLQSNLIYFLYYFICTFLIAATVFLLDIHFLLVRASKPSGEKILPTEKGASQWKAFLLLFCILLVSLIVPLFLAQVLSPEIWFVLIISFTSGTSIAEIFFYLRTR